MSRWKVITVVLILGLGIGGLVPTITAWWPTGKQTQAALTNTGFEPSAIGKAQAQFYHFSLNQGVLSVVEGKPGVKGRQIISGLSVESWPAEILQLAPQVEFQSLDEVQSFIDTVNEHLWQE